MTPIPFPLYIVHHHQTRMQFSHRTTLSHYCKHPSSGLIRTRSKALFPLALFKLSWRRWRYKAKLRPALQPLLRRARLVTHHRYIVANQQRQDIIRRLRVRQQARVELQQRRLGEVSGVDETPVTVLQSPGKGQAASENEEHDRDQFHFKPGPLRAHAVEAARDLMAGLQQRKHPHPDQWVRKAQEEQGASKDDDFVEKDASTARQAGAEDTGSGRLDGHRASTDLARTDLPQRTVVKADTEEVAKAQLGFPASPISNVRCVTEVPERLPRERCMSAGKLIGARRGQGGSRAERCVYACQFGCGFSSISSKVLLCLECPRPRLIAFNLLASIICPAPLPPPHVSPHVSP
jgi:hypothetical protein